MKAETRPISVRITAYEASVINTVIARGEAISQSDFLRQALRDKIKEVEAGKGSNPLP